MTYTERNPSMKSKLWFLSLHSNPWWRKSVLLLLLNLNFHWAWAFPSKRQIFHTLEGTLQRYTSDFYWCRNLVYRMVSRTLSIFPAHVWTIWHRLLLFESLRISCISACKRESREIDKNTF